MSFIPTTIPTKTLAQNLSSTGLVLYLNNTLSWDGSQLSDDDFGTEAWAVLRNAANTQIELIQFDPTTVTSAAAITITKRGLDYSGGTTANAETAYDWNAFDTYVELGADTPQLFQALKNYIDGIAIAGTVFATTALPGVVEIATQAEVDAGTATGGSGALLIPTNSTLRNKLMSDYAADTVGSDAYAITVTPVITAYTAGQIFSFKVGAANTGSATLAVSGLAAKTIKKNKDEDLVTGDILSGQIVMVEYDGVNFQLLSKTPIVTPTTQVVTASGTWTKPAGLKYAIVEVVGGGGGGGGVSTATTSGGGGGGGGYSKKIIAAASLGATETVTVGAAGTAGGTGGTGGTTSFGAHCQATGGAGGTSGDAGGAGGVGSGGDINIAGQGGGSGNAASVGGGQGGSSVLGGGAAGGDYPSDGSAGGAYGGGGSGSASTGSVRPGGAGAAGVVIIQEFYS